MDRIAWGVAIAIALAGCSKADPSTPKYWEKLLENPKKSEEGFRRIGDELKDPKQREWAARLVVKHWDLSPEGAAEALGKLRHPNPEGIQKLTAALGSNDPGLMAKAARALRRLGGSQAVPELIRILEKWTPKNPRDLTPVRTEVVKALGTFRSREAVPALVQMALERSHGLIVNLRAIEALGEIADTRAIPALIRSLYLACPEDKCSAAARLALNRIGKPAIPALLKVVARQDPQIEALAKEKKLGEGQVTAVAFVVLGDIGGADVARRLARDFLRGPESFSKVNAISAIGFIGGDDLVQALIRAYPKSLLEARTNILHALHRIGDRSAIPFLLKVIRQREDPNLLWTAGLAASYLGGEEELDDLQAVLDREKSRLGRLEGERKALARQTITYFTDFVARLRAAKGCKDASCWIEKLRKGDRPSRIKAARMLAFAKVREPAEDALIAALGDPDPDVREEVAFALGKVGSPRAVPFLERRIAEDKDKSGMRGALFLYSLLAARLRGRAGG
jgi:HEAT repeat protein